VAIKSEATKNRPALANGGEQPRTQTPEHSRQNQLKMGPRTPVKTLDMWRCRAVTHVGSGGALSRRKPGVRGPLAPYASEERRWSSGNCLLDPHRVALAKMNSSRRSGHHVYQSCIEWEVW